VRDLFPLLRESFSSNATSLGNYLLIEHEYESGIPIRPGDGKYVGPASEGKGA
jgi:hypothetical protein